MITNFIVHKFLASVRWIFIEAIVYQLLLALHQLMVFRTAPSTLFGMAGTIFASMYLVIAITNFGFDHTLSSFFIIASQSKKHFHYLLTRQLLCTIGIITSIACCFLYLQTAIPISCAIIIAGLCVVESIKKSCITILHIAFCNKPVALIEISSLLFYIITIWASYYLGISFSLNLIFLPLLITSTISFLSYAYLIYSFYRQLPEEMCDTDIAFYSRILQTRAYSWINHMSHLFFSSNFLVPFFAYHYGLSYAGLLKLISTLSYSLSSIVRKIGGATSGALFAYHKRTSNHQQHFALATHIVHQLLYGIIIFFSINYHKILGASDASLSSSHLILAYFFLLITISEALFITYETFLITQEKAHYLVIFNCVTLAILFFLLRIIQHTAPLATLIILLSVRLITFACMYWYAYYQWRIKPSWHVNILSQLVVLITSLLFFVFV